MKRAYPNSVTKPNISKKHWTLGLFECMKDPAMIVTENESLVVIKDGYNKARFHYLVCTKLGIKGLVDVSKNHLNHLQEMHTAGMEVARQHSDVKFLLGYHTVPSLAPLHLHVISDDFDSPMLKNKKHYNSFTTKFFFESSQVIQELEKDGKIHLMAKHIAEEFLKSPLKCHKCGYLASNIPILKKHLHEHVESAQKIQTNARN